MELQFVLRKYYDDMFEYVLEHIENGTFYRIVYSEDMGRTREDYEYALSVGEVSLEVPVVDGHEHYYYADYELVVDRKERVAILWATEDV